MKKNYLIDFRGPALTLDQVAEKAAYVETTFISLRSRNKELSSLVFWGGMIMLIAFSVALYCLQRGSFSPYITPLGAIAGYFALLLMFVLAVALVIIGALFVSSNSLKFIVEKEAAEVFAEEKIYFTWLSTASKDEMLAPAKSLTDAKFFKQVMDHPAGGVFSGYIQGVLQQRDMTVYEKHFLTRDFGNVADEFNKVKSLEDAAKLLRDLTFVNSPTDASR